MDLCDDDVDDDDEDVTIKQGSRKPNGLRFNQMYTVKNNIDVLNFKVH